MSRPNLEGLYGITANPLRLVFMMGTVWKLAAENNQSGIDILEIGSWCGASALTWGEALEIHNQGTGSLTCVDAWEPFVNLEQNPDRVSQDMDNALADEEPFDIFQHNIKFLPPSVDVDIRRGWSSDVLPTLDKESFDLIYIDGDHAYPSVASDIKLCSALLKDGGIICGDDLELQAHQVDASFAKNQPDLDKYYDEDLAAHYHPGVTLAVSEKFGSVSSWFGYWAMQKKGAAWQTVSLDGMPAHIPSNISPKSLIGLKALLMEHGLL
jgi:predicted O-methyltransferase YrrM